MQSIQRRVVGPLTVAFLLSLSVVTYAQFSAALELKTFSGAQCNFSQPGQGDLVSRLPPKFQNKSTATKSVTCPVSRARDENYFSAATILTSPGVDPFSCKVRVRSWTDGSAVTFSHTGMLPIGGSQQVRFMGSGATNNFYIGGNSSVTITCDVPAEDSVLTYTFDGGSV